MAPENHPPKNHSTGQPPAPCRLFIGTSGYAYGEWMEAGFYPAGTRANTMPGHYAQTFGAVELNYTWYPMPRAEKGAVFFNNHVRAQAPKNACQLISLLSSS